MSLSSVPLQQEVERKGPTEDMLDFTDDGEFGSVDVHVPVWITVCCAGTALNLWTE